MNGKIESTDQNTNASISEYSPDFILWLVTIACGTLLMVFTTGISNYPAKFSWEKMFFTPSWINVGGATVEEGIREFQGTSGTGNYEQTRLEVLVNLCLGCVVGPLLLLCSRRMIVLKESKNPVEHSRFPNVYIILFVLGGMITLQTILPAGVVVMNVPRIHQEMIRNNTLAENRDGVVNEMVALGFEAMQHALRPKEYNGGNGKFLIADDGKNGMRSIRANDLPSYKNLRWGSYVLTVQKGDTTIELVGVGKIVSDRPTFTNADRNLNKIQYRLTASTSLNYIITMEN